MKIRKEKITDYEKVYSVVKSAFKSSEHSDGNEQDLVVSLRKSEAFIPELSLVAIKDDKIVGHILFTKIKIGNSTELALAPLSVEPNYQKQGIGTVLIKEGHKIAKDLGYNYSVVLGSEKYYPRVGYQKANKFSILSPFDVPDKNFMAIDLQGNSKPVSGVVEYSKEFGV